MDEFEIESEILEPLSDDLRKIGLYLRHHSFGMLPNEGQEVEFTTLADSSDEISIRDIVASGTGNFFMVLNLEIGNLAWSDRVLNPENYTLDQEFMKIAPNEMEIFQALVEEEKDDLLDFPDD